MFKFRVNSESPGTDRNYNSATCNLLSSPEYPWYTVTAYKARPYVVRSYIKSHPTPHPPRSTAIPFIRCRRYLFQSGRNLVNFLCHKENINCHLIRFAIVCRGRERRRGFRRAHFKVNLLLQLYSVSYASANLKKMFEWDVRRKTDSYVVACKLDAGSFAL